MRKTLFGLMAIIAITACNYGCSGNSQKLAEKEKELEELRQLAELDKREMENQYAEYAAQYGEMKRSIKDDSLVARLDAEQKRAERLLQELKQVKSSSSAEILRLKKELATVRAVLKDYIRQVDSLMQENQVLTSQRDEARQQYAEASSQISSLSSEREQLNEKVAIAAQLDATAIGLTPLKKNGKEARKSKDVKSFGVSFTISKNVTAATGNRTVYVRLMKPNQTVAGAQGNFKYENRDLEFSASKNIEYTGQEQRVSMFIPISEFLTSGTYTIFIFCDGRMIGQGSHTLAK